MLQSILRVCVFRSRASCWQRSEVKTRYLLSVEVQSNQECLEVLLAQDPGDNDLIDAIGFLHMSLGEDDDRAGMSGSEVVWGDPNHVDDCHEGYKGEDAFQHEQEACDRLDAYVENEENDGFGFGAAIEAVRQSLAEADEILAATAIADAIAEDGHAGDIAVAQELKAEGDAAAASGGSEICDVALDKYEEAWEKAVHSWCDTPGDIDVDGESDLLDFAMFAQCFGLHEPAGACSPVLFDRSDSNDDGSVSLVDFATFAAYFGQ